MEQKSYRKYTFWAQFVFWLILFSLIYFGPELKHLPVLDRILYVMKDLFRFAILVYINYLFLMPRFMMRKEYKKYILYLGILLALNLAYDFWDYDFLPYEATSKSFHLFFGTLVTVFFLGVTSLYKFVEFWFKNIRIKEQLRNQKLEAELNFLKSQINPHFLFNILNNIYTLAYMKDDNAAPMIAKLSEMMRYMLYDCGDNRVPLIREVALLQNYVDLQLLKTEGYVNVDFYSEGIRNEHSIAPLLLVSFIENCFKHGDIDSNPNAWIVMYVEVDEEDCMHFHASNSKRSIPSNEGSKGIGLTNVKRQLRLHYPSRHEIEIEETEKSFRVDVKIRLKEPQ